MRPADLEAWVLQLVEQLERGARVEDARVELKAEWPDPVRAARRIAGHANAARGDPVLWIIGIDEHQQLVRGAAAEELASWWPRVSSWFESVAPSVMDLNVPCGDQVVVALLFETTRAPYVVRNREGFPELEVPWREATRVRSARREDLVRMLTLAAQTPDVEVLAAHLERDSWGTSAHKLVVKLYLVPRGSQRVCFPFHRATARVEGRAGWTRAIAVSMHSDARNSRVTSMVHEGPSEVVADGPGTIFVEASLPDAPVPAETVRAIVELRTTDDTPPVTVDVVLSQRGSRWELRPVLP